MATIYDGGIKVTVYGESHGSEIGGVITGFPAGVDYDEDFVLGEMARRAPSSAAYSTARKESDAPIVTAGIYDGKTTGSPIAFRILNTDTRSKDYADEVFLPRPSHADYTARVRYRGYNDGRGGGHFSGRLTAPIVFAGAMCKLLLVKSGVKIGAHIRDIGDIRDGSLTQYADGAILDGLKGELPMIDRERIPAVEALLKEVRADGDSIGCAVECGAYNVAVGMGGYGLDCVESRLSAAMFAVPAVKGIEFGGGYSYAMGRGSEKNDLFAVKDGRIVTETNNNGGILGGITDGMPIVFTVFMKPTPSIFKPQKTVDMREMREATLQIKGRHDPCVGIRAIPVIESVCAIVLADLYREAYGYDGVK